MSEPSTPNPTGAELEILRVLWERGPSTVREVHQAIGRIREIRYTTTLKLLQIMTGKGLVARATDDRSHVYRARQPRETTERHLVDDLLERAFGGSAATLVMRALESKPASAEELEEIRRMIGESKPEKEKDRD